MQLLLPLIFVATSALVNSPEIQCSSSDSVEISTKSFFYDSFLPENIDQVIQSASTIPDLEPDLAASEDHDEDEVKIHKETGHDDKSKKKHKSKKNFHYSEWQS